MTKVKEKILCLGLAKTGTTSLAAALEILGYKVSHSHSILSRITNFALAGEKWSLVNQLKMADCFLDWPHPAARSTTGLPVFQIIANYLPNTRFIYTTRDVDSWLNSCLLHVLHARVTGSNPWTQIDTQGLLKEREDLDSLTRQFAIKHPNRLLTFDIFDIDTRNGWKPLCEFLNKPIPNLPLPCENTGVRRLEELLDRYSSKLSMVA